MALCPQCKIRKKRAAPHAEMTKEYFNVLIEALKYVSYKCGYALAVHGSLEYDIDLIACPWRDNAVSAEYLSEQIKLTVKQIIGFAEEREIDSNPYKKPYGRLAWAIYLVPEPYLGPYIDLSIMPRN